MKNKYSNWIIAFLFLSGLIIVYKTVDNFKFVTEFLGRVTSILSPFIWGFIIAFLLNIPVNALKKLFLKSKHKFFNNHSKGLSIGIVYFVVLIVFSVVLRIVIPAIYKNLQDLYFNVPYYLELMITKINELQTKFDLALFEFDKNSAIEFIQSFIKNFRFSEISKYAQGIINATSGLLDVFIAIISSVYMLLDKERIIENAKRIIKIIFGRDKFLEITEFFSKSNSIFQTYIFSVLIDALLVGIVSTIVMSILKVRYAIVLGLLISLFSLIPYFGAIIAVAISVIVTLLTGGFWQAFWVLILLIILQQIDGNFIGPKIMGNMLKARPLLIILAVTLGGGLWGVGGMIIAVPVVVVLKMLIEELLTKIENKKAETK